MIRLTEVRLDDRAEELAIQVLRSGQLAQGPMVAQFETEFARVPATKHVVAVSSGTAALVAALRALHLAPGDEVITTPFTFVATLNAALDAGATVRLVDIVRDDFTIDPMAVADAIGPRTRAIIPVHLYGYPADLHALQEIASDTDIVIVEDAAQAHAAAIDGVPVGSWGMAAFSFYATKNLTTGEGGAVSTNNDEWADRLRLIRNQGMRRRYEYEVRGDNYRMTELQAAIGLSQLSHLDEWTARRRDHAERLNALLSDIEGLLLPREVRSRRHVYHQFTVRLQRDAGLDRDIVSAEMAFRGVETGIYYPRLCHDYPCYRGLTNIHASGLKEARLAAREVLSLPVHQWLSIRDIEEIAQLFHDAVRQHRSRTGAGLKPS
jgi:dTDP-4-amino-4,6-dideoxygalactose transaminase